MKSRSAEESVEDRQAARSRYFGDVSRAFLRLRGAPFILSARELHVLSAWEREGIPLAAVLAGLEQAFRGQARGPSAAKPGSSLVFCDSFVRRANDQRRDRAVGRRRPPGGTAGRMALIRKEAASFLEEMPPELAGLEPLFRRVLGLVEAGGDCDADLERIEKEVEETLFKLCPAEERKKAEGDEQARARVLKNLRVRFRVPFVSAPFY